MDTLEGEWAVFKQVLAKRSTTMEEQIPALQAKIHQEEDNVNAKIKDIENERRDDRPKEASERPEVASSQIKKALNFMTILGGKITKGQGELQRICKAKDLLEMEPGDPHALDTLKEDHQNLNEVWHRIGEVWSTMDKVDRTPFNAYIFKDVKDALDPEMNEMREFPNRIRGY